MAPGWTHLVEFGSVFCYNRYNGSAALERFEFRAGNVRHSRVGSWGPGYFSANWTHITPVGYGNVLLFYDGLTGSVAIVGPD
jgi:hypothetical protein